MKLKIFVKDDCPKCPAAKEVAMEFMASAQVFDIDEPDGLAEAAYHSVMCTPSMVIVDDSEKEVNAWRCMVPSKVELVKHMNGQV